MNLIFQTKNRDSGETNNCTIYTDTAIHINYDKLKINNISMFNTFYNITNYNKKISLTELATPIADGELTIGYYTPTLLATELERVLNTLATANTYTIDFNSITGKFEISLSAGTTSYIISFPNSSTDYLYKTLGFITDTGAPSTLTTALTQTSNYAASTLTNIIYFNLYINNNLMFNLTPVKNNSASHSGYLIINNSYGVSIIYDKNDYWHEYDICNINSINSMRIQLYDSEHNLLQNNNIDYQIAFKLE